MQMPYAILSVSQLTADLLFPRFSTSPQQTAKSQSKIDNGQYGVEHVHVKYTFILTAFLHVLPPDLDLFEYDLEGISPRVFAEAASLPSLVA